MWTSCPACGTGQRLQQDRVDDGEDGRVGADADRQGQDGGPREAPILPQQPEREAGILHELFHLSLYVARRGPVQPIEPGCQPFRFC